jgi:uncharacterized protein YraI
MVAASQTVNLRTGPGTGFAIAGTLSAGQSLEAVGQVQAADGFRWYSLANGAWVRSDIVTGEGDCAALPVVDAPAAPPPPAAQPPPPAATEEPGS